MIADVRVVQWVAVAFAVLWLGVTLGSAWCIHEVWRHYARWKRLETGSKALPLYLDVLPTTFSDVRRLYAEPGLDEGEVESERWRRESICGSSSAS